MIDLFEDEKILTESDSKVVSLTTHRICYEEHAATKSYNQNIMLEHVTSTEVFRHNPIYILVLAGICIVFALYMGTQGYSNETTIAAVIGVILAILYVLSRKNIIIIGSPSTKMKINASNMSRDNILSFVNKVEQAKYERIKKLNTLAGISE